MCGGGIQKNYPRFFKCQGYNYDEKLNWTEKQRHFCNKLSQLKSTKIAIGDNTQPNGNMLMYSDHLTIYHCTSLYTSEHQRFYQIHSKCFKCPDNTIIGDFFSCAHFYGQSGVTRDPHMLPV